MWNFLLKPKHETFVKNGWGMYTFWTCTTFCWERADKTTRLVLYFNLVGHILKTLDDLSRVNMIANHSFIPDDEVFVRLVATMAENHLKWCIKLPMWNIQTGNQTLFHSVFLMPKILCLIWGYASTDTRHILTNCYKLNGTRRTSVFSCLVIMPFCVPCIEYQGLLLFTHVYGVYVQKPTFSCHLIYEKKL